MARNTNKQPKQKEEKEFMETVVEISRVSKKTKGGNQIGFTALMVVGDKKGKVGVCLGKAKDVSSAIQKGIRKAKKEMIQVPMNGTTIPFAMELKDGAGHVLLKPAPKGSGVIAGGPVRAVVEAAGIRDISSKIMGTNNKLSTVYATFKALEKIANIVKKKGIKLKSIAEIEREEKEKERKRMQEMRKKGKKTVKQSEKKVQKKSNKKTKPKNPKKTVKSKSKKGK